MPLGIGEYFVAGSVVSPLSLMRIVHAPVAVTRLNLLGRDQLSYTLLVELGVHLILINDVAFVHGLINFMPDIKF